MMSRIDSINNPFFVMNHSDIWRTSNVDQNRVLVTPAIPARQHPFAESILDDALSGRFGNLLGEGSYGRVYDTSHPELVVKQVCNAGGRGEIIGLSFDILELNIAAGRIAHKLSLGKGFEHWRLTAPKIHAAVIRGEMLHNKYLNPPASPKPPEDEHLFVVMEKLDLLSSESIQSEICADTFPSWMRVAETLSIALQGAVIDVSDSRQPSGLKKLHNMGVMLTPISNDEPGIIGVYDL